jgi:hypothetical protein
VKEQRIQGSFAYSDLEFGRALGLLEWARPSGRDARAVPTRGERRHLHRLLAGPCDGFLKAIVCPA